MKKLISLVLAAVMCIGMGTTALAADINVTVDGQAVTWTDAKPFIKDGRTLVPLRPIANALGLAVFWNGDTQKASFSDGETTVAFELNSKEYVVYGAKLAESKVVKMDTAAISENGRTYAPAKYLAQAFGYTVGWDQATQTVKITSGDVATEPEASGDNLYDLTHVVVAEEDLEGTMWYFAGGFVDGVELTDEEYQEHLMSFGGYLSITFVNDSVVEMSEGGVQFLYGTYEHAGFGVYDLFFEDGENFACKFTESDGEVYMIVMPDATGLNGVYFKQ
ncbi:MAG: copper amine oxidase N-terminal domain-containing protein [Anaerotignum sp.]|nr:copper amine oxidase N-terminal domain-containing protein [Anaerotignum sp.]